LKDDRSGWGILLRELRDKTGRAQAMGGMNPWDGQLVSIAMAFDKVVEAGELRNEIIAALTC
jgi:hypothetical protein